MAQTWQSSVQPLSPRPIWLLLAMTNKKMRCNQKQKALRSFSLMCSAKPAPRNYSTSSINPLAKSIWKSYWCTYSRASRPCKASDANGNKYYTSQYTYHNLSLCNLIALNTLHKDLGFFSIFWKCLAISHVGIYRNEETLILKTPGTKPALVWSVSSVPTRKSHLLRYQRNSSGPESLCLPFPFTPLNSMRTPRAIHSYTKSVTILPGSPTQVVTWIPTNPSGPGTHTHSPVITTRSRQHPQTARTAAATAAAAHWKQGRDAH